jgi:diketogulonate reductase-like aldo/keto reductase
VHVAQVVGPRQAADVGGEDAVGGSKRARARHGAGFAAHRGEPPAMRTRTFGFGATVPMIGQGTWNVATRGAARTAAIEALRAGIGLGMTHIDTAEMYGDGAAEELIAEAIAGIPRHDLFIVSKVLPTNAGYDGTIAACERSLQRLKTDYLDCYLLHWRGSRALSETMRALERLVEDGKIRSLGVSNFDVDDLREAQAGLRREKIVCNQVLYHLGQRSIEEHELPFCHEHGIAIVAYTPFGRGDWHDAKGRAVLERIAQARGVGAHAVILAFLCRDDAVYAIPKAGNLAHVAENAAAGDLVLSADEVAAIDAAFPAKRRRGGIPTL